jgi:GTP pyrophosphokinase
MDQQRYLAPVLITAHDRSGLIRDIATVVSELNVNMTSVSSTVNSNHEHVLISATLEVDGLDQLQRVFAKLEKVKNVLHVERDLGKKRRKSA